jgi:hypothetical protein
MASHQTVQYCSHDRRCKPRSHRCPVHCKFSVSNQSRISITDSILWTLLQVLQKVSHTVLNVSCVGIVCSPYRAGFLGLKTIVVEACPNGISVNKMLHLPFCDPILGITRSIKDHPRDMLRLQVCKSLTNHSSIRKTGEFQLRYRFAMFVWKSLENLQHIPRRIRSCHMPPNIRIPTTLLRTQLTLCLCSSKPNP